MSADTKARLELGPGETTARMPTATVKEHPFLDGLTAHQYRILTDCALPTHFNTGELIFREGDPADYFYLIQTGKVALESHAHDEGISLVQIIQGGEVLGWSWLFPPYFWHFDARALVPTDALCICATALRDECEADHELAYALTKRLALVMLKRLQATRKQLLELRRRSPWIPA